MEQSAPEIRLTRKLVDSLYVEAMVLADEARAYFETYGTEERDALNPALRVTYAVESLKVTTRIMHVIAWLLTWRGSQTDEISVEAASHPDRRLGKAGTSDGSVVGDMPEGARELIEASTDLYDRVRRFEQDLLRPPDAPAVSPAKSLIGRLERAF